MDTPPPPRGRGALLLALKKKADKQKQIGIVEGLPPPEPPKSKGRAAYLKQLQEEKLKKVGVQQKVVSSPEIMREMKAKPDEKELEDISIGVSEMSTERESLTYRGETGKPVRTQVNYIKLFLEKDRGVYEYEVQFKPELDAKNRRTYAINSIMKEMKTAKVFDGGSVLYLPQQLSETVTTYTTTLRGPDSEITVDIVLIFKRKRNNSDSECLHLYNVLFKRIMHILLYTPIGRNYFNPQHTSIIPQHKLEIYPGFAVTVDDLEDGLMLCLDTQHRVIRTENAYQLMLELKAANSERFRENVTSSLIGSCVLTKYNNRTYVIDDIAWDMTPEDTFPTRDGRVISFVEYYKLQYNIKIQDVSQPMLVHRRTVKVSGQTEKQERMVCLVPELSCLTNLTDSMRSDFKVMKDVAQYTRVTPNQRAAALKTYLDNVTKSQEAQKVLADWGLRIDRNPVELQGRQLENEELYFGGGVVERPRNADWNREAGNNKVIGPVDMLIWLLVCTKRDEKIADDFGRNMCRLGGVMGCTINFPKKILLPDDRNESYVQACKHNIVPRTQIIVFICPTMRTDRYSVIKNICCSQVPVPCQVINARTLANPKKVRSITQKIALQMTCKLGGSLWTVRFPFKGWMIVGIDVYHSTNGQQSVCGFVSSMNESMTQWFSVALFQEQELGDFLKIAFTKCLENFRNTNGTFPSKVVVIRDGVGDGQFDFCKRYEVAQLESVKQQFDLDFKLMFVVVQKRISTRIYSISGNETENPSPGTVLDHGVTRKYLLDFFLVPQSVRQGTVNPTHYIVLHDTCKLKPDQIQRLCYKLCHLYYNWSGTIRVPAPCQYAHKLAALVGQHIKKAPSAVLSDKLFYL